MKPLSGLIMLICLALLAAMPAPAQCAPDKTKSLDANQDGKIDLNEWLVNWVDKEAGKKKFQQRDRNKDGYLDEHDARAVFNEMDRDKDGKISKGEYSFGRADAEAADNEFVDYDSNRDFSITYGEWRNGWYNGWGNW